MTSISQRITTMQFQISSNHRNIAILLSMWILTMITVPIQSWLWGSETLPRAITLGLLTQFIAVFYITQHHWGFKQTVITLTVVSVLTWLAEYIGSSTGFPFGEYDYTDVLQPQIGHVPLIIPLAWFMMLPPSWAVAQAITKITQKNSLSQHIIFAGVSALSFTAWDLFLDPQMVSWNFWIWDNPEGYFGIPWINYAGWILTAFIVTLFIRPKSLPIIPLLMVYGVVWFLQSFGQFFFWEQQGPAIVGFIVMGFFLFAAIYRHLGQSS